MAERQAEQAPARLPTPQTEAQPLAAALAAEERFREQEAQAPQALFGLILQEVLPVLAAEEEEKLTPVLQRTEAQAASVAVAEVPAVTPMAALAVTAALLSPTRRLRLPLQARLPTQASPQAPSP